MEACASWHAAVRAITAASACCLSPPLAGTYSGPQNTNLTLSSNLTLTGIEGTGLPTVDCAGSGRAMTIASSAALKGGGWAHQSPAGMALRAP